MSVKPMVCHIDHENFASSEKAATRGGEPLTTLNVETEKIIDDCRGCRTLLGDFVSYNEKAGRILEAALGLRRLLNKHPELISDVRKEASRHRQTMLGSSKLDLICLNMCVEAVSEEERKKCSKFSKVVAGAHAAGVEPQNASEWLKRFRVANAAKRRAEKSCPTRFSMRFLLGAFPLLAAATEEGKGWPSDQRVSEELTAVAQRCEKLLREAASLADPANTTACTT